MEYAKVKAARKLRYAAVFASLTAAIFLIIIININTGSVHIPAARILRILFTRTGEESEVSIIWKIRMPRIVTAAVLGGALALSGFLLQTFFGNPIAGPFVLGISSGAKMCVALAMIVMIGRFGAVSSWTLILAAFIGAMLSTSFILIVSRSVRQMAGLLVAGIMIGYICSAVTEFLVTFAEDADIVNLHGWSQGSFSGADWQTAGTAALITCAAAVCVFFLSKPMAAYQMGEAYARSMGVNIRTFRMELILLSGILSACVAAFAGPVSFVGIAVPFMVRRMLGTSRPVIVIPAAFLGGAAFCMFSDLLARMAFAPTELNISTVTSFLGAPVVIYMLVNKTKKS